MLLRENLNRRDRMDFHPSRMIRVLHVRSDDSDVAAVQADSDRSVQQVRTTCRSGPGCIPLASHAITLGNDRANSAGRCDARTYVEHCQNDDRGGGKLLM
jgi:hypothetical protein